MKNLITILSLFLFIQASAQTLNNVILNGPEITNVEIIQGVKISDILVPGDNFSNLSYFGVPKEKICTQTTVEEICQLTFESGIEIEYRNLNGEFELSRITISTLQKSLKINGLEVTVGRIFDAENSNSRSNVILRKGVKEYGDKLNGHYSYFEININSDNGEIEKVEYRRTLL